MTGQPDHIEDQDLLSAMTQIRRLQAEAVDEGDTERLRALERRADWIRYLAVKEDPDYDANDGQEHP